MRPFVDVRLIALASIVSLLIGVSGCGPGPVVWRAGDEGFSAAAGEACR